MGINIQTLINLISEMEKPYLIKYVLLKIMLSIFQCKINIIKDNKEEFDLSLAKIEKDINKISRLKAILYQKNNEFKLSDGRNIQEAIVDNTNLRKLKTTYERLLLLKNSKRRVTEVNNSYFECKNINFDSKELRKKLEKLDQDIQKTDFEISKLNSIEFEI